MRISKSIPFLFAGFVAVSCGETEFKSEGKKMDPPRGSFDGSGQPTGNANGDSPDFESGTDSNINNSPVPKSIYDDSNLSNENGLIGGSGDNASIKNECYFAISGIYFDYHYSGSNTGKSTFPLTQSGNKIKTGERFGNRGGIYLNARDEPFAPKSPSDPTYDAIIKYSLDSFALGEGMRVEVRDEAGREMFARNGPLVALSAQYPHDGIKKVLRGLESKMQPWMKEYLNSVNYNLPSFPMNAARWVKVSAIPNSKCDID